MVSYYKIGNVYFETNDFEKAIKKFRLGVEVLDQMIANGQNAAQAKQEKSVLENRIAQCNDAISDDNTTNEDGKTK